VGVGQTPLAGLDRASADGRVNVLVTGNMGYVGPPVASRLRSSRPDSRLVGFDAGYFAHCLSTPSPLPERILDRQHFGDIRDFPDDALAGIDAVVHLAAVSNDPIGNAFEAVTLEVNADATVELARKARDAGAHTFVFAASCSMYGFAEEGPRTEDSPLEPLTAYSRSKVDAERGLAAIADDAFTVTSMRFGTACGVSDRLRLDLVLNDFAASAVASGAVVLLSDGTPWRPLIHVRDMARAIDWGLDRRSDHGGAFLVVNVGAEASNFQMLELARAVVDAVDGTELEVSAQAQPDRRSYKVDFRRFEDLAPDHQPRVSLEQTIEELVEALRRIDFRDTEFRSRSELVRLNVLRRLRDEGLLAPDLRWAVAAPAALAAES
jgi:nucleoside-diphosphate-sugar epimerase